MRRESLFNMFLNREQINHLSSRTPAQRVEGFAAARTGHEQIPPPAARALGMTYFPNHRF
jgi:hypothetical protein